MSTRRPLLLGVVTTLLAVGAACGNNDDEAFSGSLDTPGPVALVRDAGLFDRPIAVVADRHGGRVRLLDLVTGRYAPTTPVASFHRDAALPLGRDRIVTSIAAVAPTPDSLWVYAADTRHDTLVRAPWITGRDDAGDPVRANPTVTTPTVTDPDDQVTVSRPVLDRGRAASETWTLTFDGSRWQVRGTRSGLQSPAPATGTWVSDAGAVRLQIEGTPSEGDEIRFTVDSGIEELDVGGRPAHVAVSPDGTHLLVSAVADDDTGRLEVGDAATGSLDWSVPLPAGSRPDRIDFDADGLAWVADLALPAVHAVDPVAQTVETLDLPWPVRDVAPVTSAAGQARLALSPVDGEPSVWLYDLAEDRFIDANASTPGVDGMRLLSPVMGLAALPEPYDLPFQRNPFDGTTEFEDQREASVAVSLASGRVVFLRADDGCLVSDRLGPRTRPRNTASGSFFDYTPSFAADPPFTAYLAAAEDSRRHVLINACSGIAPTESWTLTYDAIEGAWRAEGSVSGEQASLAFEDGRWTSDRGEVSVLIRAGSTPSTDGWTFRFDVLEGVLAAAFDGVAEDLPQITLDLPADPIAYVRPRGSTDDDEREDSTVPEVVVAAQSEDVVVRIDARTGVITGLWD